MGKRLLQTYLSCKKVVSVLNGLLEISLHLKHDFPVLLVNKSNLVHVVTVDVGIDRIDCPVAYSQPLQVDEDLRRFLVLLVYFVRNGWYVLPYDNSIYSSCEFVNGGLEVPA